MDRSKDNPFFLYFAFNAVHSPMESASHYAEKFPELSGNRKTYAGMLSALDTAIGRVMAKVRELGQLPDSDAVRDAAGRGQLFEAIHVAGFTDVGKGMNGFALADLNHDGRPDIVATLTPPVVRPESGPTTGNVQRMPLRQTVDQLLVLINEGGFRFRPHALSIRGSALTPERFGQRTQIPNLANFNGDGHPDLLITRSLE